MNTGLSILFLRRRRGKRRVEDAAGWAVRSMKNEQRLSCGVRILEEISNMCSCRGGICWSLQIGSLHSGLRKMSLRLNDSGSLLCRRYENLPPKLASGWQVFYTLSALTVALFLPSIHISHAPYKVYLLASNSNF